MYSIVYYSQLIGNYEQVTDNFIHFVRKYFYQKPHEIFSQA